MITNVLPPFLWFTVYKVSNLLNDNVAQFANGAFRHVIANHTHCNTTKHEDYNSDIFTNINVNNDCRVQQNTMNN